MTEYQEKRSDSGRRTSEVARNLGVAAECAVVISGGLIAVGLLEGVKKVTDGALRIAALVLPEDDDISGGKYLD